MISKIKKLVSIILSILMVVSVFAIVPIGGIQHQNR